jgi:putative transposase
MRAFSLDLRERVYHAYLHREGSVVEVARIYQVSEEFIYKLQHQMDTLGHIQALPHGGGHPQPLSSEQEERLRSWVEEKPDATLAELCQRCLEEQEVRLDKSTLCRLLQKMGLPRKKKALSRRRPVQPSGRNSPRWQRVWEPKI